MRQNDLEAHLPPKIITKRGRNEKNLPIAEKII